MDIKPMTQKTVSIQIPEYEDSDDLVSFFSEALRDEFGNLFGDFVVALDTDVSIHHDRATLDDIEIEAVEIHEDGSVVVEYRVTYSWYLGCSDMDGAGEEYECAHGEKNGPDWVFKIPLPHVRRTTMDEF
jgi:hypothetical protein